MCLLRMHMGKQEQSRIFHEQRPAVAVQSVIAAAPAGTAALPNGLPLRLHVPAAIHSIFLGA